jgi:hypothetical protein
MTLTILKVVGQVFCRLSSYWDFSDVFLMTYTRVIIHLGQEDSRGKLPLSYIMPRIQIIIIDIN